MCEQNYMKVNFMLHAGLANVYTFKFKFLYFFMDDISNGGSEGTKDETCVGTMEYTNFYLETEITT